MAGLDTYTLAVTLILCLCKCVEACGDVLCGILQRNDHLYQAGISLTLKFILAVGLFIGFDLMTGNMVISSLIMTIGWIMVTVLYDIPKTKNYLKNQTVDKNRVIELTKKGFPSFGVLFLATFLVNATKYLMYGNVSEEEQGIYGMIIMPATMLTLCVQYILQPYLKALSTQFKERNEKDFRKLVRLLVGATGLIGVVFLAGMALMGAPVLSIIYSTDLSGHVLPLLIIIFGAIFYSLSTVVSAVLTTLRILNEQLVCSLIAGAAEVVIALVLIQKWMLTGAAMSYCLTMIILCLLYGVLYLKKAHAKFIA
jgi:O-antigen/teichoic acid export membrane protein